MSWKTFAEKPVLNSTILVIHKSKIGSWYYKGLAHFIQPSDTSEPHCYVSGNLDDDWDYWDYFPELPNE